MTIVWDKFNSNLLDQLKSKYQGHFLNKFILALEKYKTSQDINQMVFTLFPNANRDVAEPDWEYFDAFGKGNIGNDTQVLLYLDTQLNAIFKLFANIQINQAQALTDHLLTLFPSSESEKEQMQKKSVPIFRSRSKTLNAYEKLLIILKGIGTKAELYVPIEDQDDLAFFGCLSLVDAFFTSKDGYYETAPFSAIFNTETNQTTGHVIPFDEDTFKALKEDATSTYPPTSMQTFQALNRGLNLPRPKFNFNQALPDLLSSSSFLWGSNNFLDISSEEAMTLSPSQKIQKIVQNKSKLIEDCLTHMMIGSNAPNLLSIDQKNAFLGLGKSLEKALKNKQAKVHDINNISKEISSIKEALIGLSEEMGLSEKQATLRLLKIINKAPQEGTHAIESSKSPPLVDAIHRYRHLLIARAEKKAHLQDDNKTIKDIQTSLKSHFEKLLHRVNQGYSQKLVKEIKLFQSYVTFSFFVLNEDIFPNISLDAETKSMGLKKLEKIFSKSPIAVAFQKLKKAESSASQEVDTSFFSEILNNQSQKIFKRYSPSSQSYKYEKISDQDLSKLAGVFGQLENAHVQDRKKFAKCEAILEKMLNRNNGFRSILEGGLQITPERDQALQAHIQATYFYKDDPQAFSKLLKSISESLTAQGVKDSIVRSNKELLKEVENVVGKNIPEETVSEIISKNLIKQGERNLPLNLEVVRHETYPSGSLLPSLERAKDNLKNYLDHQIFGEDYRWLKAVEDFKHVFNPNFKLSAVSFSTYNQAYREPFDDIFDRNIQHFLTSQANFLTPERLIDDFRLYIQKHQKRIRDYDKQQKAVFDEGKIRVTDSREILLSSSYLAVIEDEIQRLKDSQVSYVVQHNTLSNRNQIDLLDTNTLFSIFDKFGQAGSQNAKKSAEAYQDYLPIFLSSFLTTENLLPAFAQDIRQAQAQFIKDLPDAQLTLDLLEDFLEKNDSNIKKLETYLTEEAQKQELANSPANQAGFIQEYLKKGSDFLKGLIPEIPFNIPLAGIVSGAIFAGLASVGAVNLASIATGGFIPLSMGICMLGCVGSYLLEQTVFPFIRQLINTIWEKINQLFETGKYSKFAPSEFALETFQHLLGCEIKLIDAIDDPKTQFVYVTYLRELFDICEQLPNNMTYFGQRINALMPTATEQTNFSVMALNMFYMLNKDISLVVPNAILQNSYHEKFPEAVEAYLSQVKSHLVSIGHDFTGEKKIVPGRHTPFSRYIQGKTKSNPQLARFTFTGDSVCDVLGENTMSFDLNFDQPFVFSAIDPELSKRNIQKLFGAMESVKEKFPLFAYFSKTAVKRFSIALGNHTLSEQDQERFTKTLVSAFETVRAGFILSQGFVDAENNLSSPYRKFLLATKETPETILNSTLFQSCLSLLKKTTQMGISLGISSGQDMLTASSEIADYRKQFLSTGLLESPSTALWDRLKLSLVDTIEQGVSQFPLIAFPSLLDLEHSPEITINVAQRERMKNHLAQIAPEDGVSILPLINSSKLLYLTNEASEAYFLDSQTRGYAFSPQTLLGIRSALNQVENFETSRFLGIVQERTANLRAIENAPSRWNIPFMQPKYARNVPSNREMQNQQPREQIEPMQSYWGQGAKASPVNPQYNLPQNAYDPENLGLSPVQSLGAYGNTLPEGVQNQIMQKSGMQPAIQNSPVQVGSRQNVGQQNVPSQIDQQINPLDSLQAMSQMMPIESGMPQDQQIQESPIESNIPMEVQVNSQGGSNAVSSSQNVYNPRDYDHIVPELGQQKPQPPSFPPADQPYVNPINQNYDPRMPENPGVNWGNVGTGLAIGGGLMAGAALMSNAMKKKKRGK